MAQIIRSIGKITDFDPKQFKNVKWAIGDNDPWGKLLNVSFSTSSKVSSTNLGDNYYVSVGLLVDNNTAEELDERFAQEYRDSNGGMEDFDNDYAETHALGEEEDMGCPECGNRKYFFTASGVDMGVCAECGTIVRAETAPYRVPACLKRATFMFFAYKQFIENEVKESRIKQGSREELAAEKLMLLFDISKSKNYFVC